jgi:hypothetical protein
MATPKGLKSTSSPLQISALVEETGANTFVSEEIPLTLNVLDNEVFVVTQINIDVDAPDLLFLGAAPGTHIRIVDASLSTTSRSTVGGINDANVVGSAQRQIICHVDATPLVAAIPFDREDPQFAAISEDYLAIVATNNMFLNLQGKDNLLTKSARVRVYGYRATASSAVYAALVQSELLSA